jgi:predicted enzyme related to lactoylglutathione lyase
MLSLNTVMINSENVEALAAFYTKALGEPQWADNGYTGWRVGAGMLMLGPHSEVKGRNEQPGRIIINLETPDVKGEFDRLKGCGATVVREPERPGPADGDFLLATLADPDGNYFQLASPMPQE